MTTSFGNIIDKYQDAPKSVIQAVQKASQKTGIDFGFLMDKASAESSFNPKAKAKSSSATGLFQFIENTWLNTVKEHGGKYGLKNYADKITIGADGKARVADPSAKKQILELRKNAEISALMAGEFCADNKEYLEDNTSCKVGSTELYLAHFMGAGGAAKFINCRDANPDASAAALFPQAARANKKIFYGENGKPRSLEQVYNLFAKKFNDGTTPPSNPAPARSPSYAAAAYGSVTASATAPSIDPLDAAAQTLPLFDDGNAADDIIWNDDPRFFGATSGQKLSPSNMLAILEMTNGPSSYMPDDDTPGRPRSHWYNA